MSRSKIVLSGKDITLTEEQASNLINVILDIIDELDYKVDYEIIGFTILAKD